MALLNIFYFILVQTIYVHYLLFKKKIKTNILLSLVGLLLCEPLNFLFQICPSLSPPASFFSLPGSSSARRGRRGRLCILLLGSRRWHCKGRIKQCQDLEPLKFIPDLVESMVTSRRCLRGIWLEFFQIRMSPHWQIWCSRCCLLAFSSQSFSLLFLATFLCWLP